VNARLVGVVTAATIVSLPASAYAAGGTWIPAAPMKVARERAVAAPLPDGAVLVAGGENEEGRLATAEIYEPTRNVWNGTTAMNTAREGAVAAPLPDGDVLVAGGEGETGLLASAEIYNPNTATWTATTAMHEAREGAVAVALPNGEVLVTGGDGPNPLDTAEQFDPVSKTWEVVSAPLGGGRDFAAGAALPNGEALIVGGKTFSRYEPLATVERYAPGEEEWQAATETVTARDLGVAAGLPDGDVLLDSGHGTETGPGGYLQSSEVYVHGTNTWSADTPPLVAREGAIAASLPNGAVLVAGGENAGGTYLASAELFYSSAESRLSGGIFGDESVGIPSQELQIAVKNVGSIPLTVASIFLHNENSADFAITSSSCVDRKVPLGEDCTIGVQFTPGAAGLRTTELTLGDNEEDGKTIVLTGHGVEGQSGATGPAGTNGAAGVNGATGAAGPPGPAAHLELITCTTVRHGHGSSATSSQTCRARPTRATVTITSSGVRIAAVLSRGGVVYAKGVAIESGRAKQILLAPIRAITSGRYALTLGSGKSRRREPLVIG
jgi:hypothetical protein